MAEKRKQSEPEEPMEIIDVDFDFFEIKEIDFWGIKVLLQQLFQQDANIFDISGLSDFIIQQGIGTVVKTDGEEGDPYSLVTVIDLTKHKDHDAVKPVVEYLSRRSSAFEDLFKKSNSLAWILSERLVNMPTEIMPHMYRLLDEELQEKHISFSDYVILSRVFVSKEGELDDDPNVGFTETSSKKKKSEVKDTEQVWLYHPEDELIEEFSSAKQVFKYERSPERKEEAFGVDIRAQLMHVKGSKWKALIPKLLSWFD